MNNELLPLGHVFVPLGDGLYRVVSDTATLFADIAAWGAATFPDSTFESTLNHFEKEIVEFRLDPHDRMERADLVFLLIQLARCDGDDLLQAIRDKFEVNRARTWQAPDRDGVVEHVREQPPE